MNNKLILLRNACIGITSLLASATATADIAEINFDSLPTGAYFPGDTVTANAFTTISTAGSFFIGPSGFIDGNGRIVIASFSSGDTTFTFDTLAVTVNSVTFTGRSNNVPVSFLARNSSGALIDVEGTDASWSLPVELSASQPIASIDVTMLESEIRSISIDFEPVVVDTDGDGMSDSTDNCVLVQNPMQEDADGDNFGNNCDTDLNNDCSVNFLDLSDLSNEFFTDNAVADFNNDGTVNFLDLEVMQGQFFGAPGPSGLTDLCETQGQ